eukprot:7950531-Pyramimonas_sp.AAC.1
MVGGVPRGPAGLPATCAAILQTGNAPPPQVATHPPSGRAPIGRDECVTLHIRVPVGPRRTKDMTLHILVPVGA